MYLMSGYPMNFYTIEYLRKKETLCLHVSFTTLQYSKPKTLYNPACLTFLVSKNRSSNCFYVFKSLTSSVFTSRLHINKFSISTNSILTFQISKFRISHFPILIFILLTHIFYFNPLLKVSDGFMAYAKSFILFFYHLVPIIILICTMLSLKLKLLCESYIYLLYSVFVI